MPKKFFVGVKGIIINTKNEILLLKCKRANDLSYWDFPGGRMEEDENVFDALTRELEEELPSIQNIKIHDFINVYHHPKIFDTGEGLFLLFYKVTADFGKITLSPEHYDYLWINKENLNSVEKHAILNEEYKNMLHKLL